MVRITRGKGGWYEREVFGVVAFGVWAFDDLRNGISSMILDN